MEAYSATFSPFSLEFFKIYLIIKQIQTPNEQRGSESGKEPRVVEEKD